MEQLETEVAAGDIKPQSLNSLKALIQEVWMPVLEASKTSFKKTKAEESQEFMDGMGKFADMLSEASASLEEGVELEKPEPK